jgi:hypothetical protein
MKEIRKLLKLPKLEYYRVHLSFINCILPKKMTPMQLSVLAAFMSLEGDIAQYRFGPSAKKIVMKELGISPAGLSNYIGDLLEAEFLIKTGDVITIWPLLVPEEVEQIYSFKLLNIGDAQH